MCRANATRAGFTLIEVMAALVIVSLGMLAVITAVTQAASNNAYVRDKTVANWVAMNRITEMRLQPQPPSVGETSGEVEMAGTRWRWTAKVSAIPEILRRIDVGVFPADSGAEDAPRLAIVTGFYGERIAQPGTVLAQFNAPPQPPAQGPGQPPGQPPPTPTPVPPPNTPPKSPPIDGEGAQ